MWEADRMVVGLPQSIESGRWRAVAMIIEGWQS